MMSTACPRECDVNMTSSATKMVSSQQALRALRQVSGTSNFFTTAQSPRTRSLWPCSSVREVISVSHVAAVWELPQALRASRKISLVSVSHRVVAVARKEPSTLTGPRSDATPKASPCDSSRTTTPPTSTCALPCSNTSILSICSLRNSSPFLWSSTSKYSPRCPRKVLEPANQEISASTSLLVTWDRSCLRSVPMICSNRLRSCGKSSKSSSKSLP
mmetsp:Transcript_14488/g.39679  ORF Transcript_14488/g.39679 Transcript_14488/m.39679 type:complete len:217 (-) Transcript_14488:4225-4875(-)